MQKRQQQFESLRWPNVFHDEELSALLFSTQAWPKLILDCQGKLQDLTYKVVHDLPTTSEAQITQAFYRGQVAVLEDIIGLESELKEWREK